MLILLTLIRTYWLFLTVVILFFITLLSLYPLASLPAVPGSDKTHHLIAYGMLTLPAALAKPKYWQYICISFIAWSGMIELIQPAVNRYGEWLDMVANMAGVVGGFLVAVLINGLTSSKNTVK